MIIDTNDDPTNDMVKMEMSADGRILAMSKTIPPERVAAEAVGPVKFSQAGGRQFIDLIGSYVAQGDLKRWFFYTIAEFAADHPFAGIKNPGFPWAEIDTPEDLAEASRKVPPPADIHDTP